MQVTVRLGEPFWRQVNAREVTVELQSGATVGLLLEELARVYPDLKQALQDEELPPIVFLGDEMAAPDSPLSDGARFNVSAKSPQTPGLGDSNCGGLSTPEAQEQLRARHGPGTVAAVIGPAGENLVRMSGVMIGPKNTAGRTGMGAVTGSKKLKAIVARGGARLQAADPAAMRQARIEQTQYLQRSGVVKVLGKLGTPFLYDVSNRLGAIRARNSQDNFSADSLNAEHIEAYSEKMLACTSCVVHCRHNNKLGGEGPEYSTVGLLGANLGIASPEHVIRLNNLVNELGMDASSTGTIIAWAMELYQRGLIDDRQDFGAVPAESTQARHQLPARAVDYLIAVKDLPQSDPHDVRYIKSFALGIAVASRGADHLRNRPTLDILRLPDDARRAIFGFETGGDPTAYEGKARMVAWHDDIYAVADCLGICRFVTHGFNSPQLLGYEQFADLIQAASGLQLTKDEIREVGRRVVDLERWLNLQFSRTRADDTLPKRYFDDPMPARATKGHRIERQPFEAMLDEYYPARGWDEQGQLCPERAAELERYLQ